MKKTISIFFVALLFSQMNLSVVENENDFDEENKEEGSNNGEEDNEEEVVNSDELTNEQIAELSETCGQMRFHKDACVNNNNCVYITHYIDRFRESMSFCYSYDELFKFYIKDDILFIKTRKLKAFKFINKDNFCDVLQRLEPPFAFLGIDGKVLECELSLK